MSGAARRFLLLACVGFGMSATAAGQDDPAIAENDILEMEIIRRADGAVLDSEIARVRPSGVFTPGSTESLDVIGLRISQIEAAIARQVAGDHQFPKGVGVRVRILESRILFSEGEGIGGRALKPLATGPKSSITIVKPPDILTITAVRRSDRFELFSGEHLVRPNGAVSLGIFGGEVEVAGLTVPATRWAITRHLAEHGYAARDLEVQIELLTYRKIR